MKKHMPDVEASEGEGEQPVGRAFGAATVLLLVLAMLTSFLSKGSGTQDTAERIGAGVSPAFLCLIILAIVSIWKRGRTPTTRYRIVFWCSLFFLLVGTVGLLAPAGDGSGRDTSTPPTGAPGPLSSETHDALSVRARDSLVGAWRPVEASTSKGRGSFAGTADMQFRRDGTMLCRTDFPEGELQTLRGRWQRAGPDVVTYSFDAYGQVERARYEFREGHLVLHHLDADVTVILERIDDFGPQ